MTGSDAQGIGTAADDADGLRLEVGVESVVVDPDVTYDDRHLDWDLTRAVVTIRGSIQSLVDLSDGLAVASERYNEVARRERLSNPTLAQQHEQLAAKWLATATALENAAMNLPVPADVQSAATPGSL